MAGRLPSLLTVIAARCRWPNVSEVKYAGPAQRREVIA
jgi:hypothetical protein